MTLKASFETYFETCKAPSAVGCPWIDYASFLSGPGGALWLQAEPETAWHAA